MKAPSFLKRVLIRAGTVSYRYPVVVVLLAFLLAVYGGYLYFFRMKMVSDRGSLVDKNTEWNRRADDYEKQFGKDEFLVLVTSVRQPWIDNAPPADPDPAQRAEMKRIAAAWAAALRTRPDLFPTVVDRVDPEELGPVGLLYLPVDRLRDIRSITTILGPRAAEISGPLTLQRIISVFRSSLVALGDQPPEADTGRKLLDGSEKGLRLLREELARTDAAARPPETGRSRIGELLSGSGFDADGYLFTSDGRMLTAFATVRTHPEKEIAVEPAVQYAKEALASILAAGNSRAGVAAGITGMPALEYDEMKTSQMDFKRGTFVSAALILLLFIFGYRSAVRPALAILSIGLAIGMTFVFIHVVIGHLNLLALIFTVMLVSIGTDYTIVFMTYYLKELHDASPPEKAIDRTLQGVGAAVLAGGATGAFSFFSAYFTEFSGLGELGIIAGTGLLFSVLCTLIVYPAMLFLLDRRLPMPATARKDQHHSPLLKMALPSRKASLVMLLLVAPLAAAGYIYGQYSFDTSLLNLQSTSGSAYLWETRLLQADDRATFAICTYRSREEMEEARRKFEARPEVFRATESLFPDREEEKREILTEALSAVSAIKLEPPDSSSVADLKRELYGLRQDIRSYRMKSKEADSALAGISREIDALYRTLSGMPADQSEQRLNRIQSEMYLAAMSAWNDSKAYLAPPAIEPARLPAVLRDRFLGKNGTFALLVYPAKDAWETSNLNEFIGAARLVDPGVFGGLVTFYENGRALIRSFLESAVFSMIVIPILILLITRSLRSTMLACVPLAAGIGLLLGLMKWAGISWNFANFFALPILIGSGVDYGVYFVFAQRNRAESGAYEAIIRATFYTAMTTIIGFGVLMFSQHRGVGSLGLILFLGTALCLATTLTLLPAILSLIQKDSHARS